MRIIIATLITVFAAAPVMAESQDTTGVGLFQLPNAPFDARSGEADAEAIELVRGYPTPGPLDQSDCDILSRAYNLTIKAEELYTEDTPRIEEIRSIQRERRYTFFRNMQRLQCPQLDNTNPADLNDGVPLLVEGNGGNTDVVPAAFETR